MPTTGSRCVVFAPALASLGFLCAVAWRWRFMGPRVGHFEFLRTRPAQLPGRAPFSDDKQ